MNDLFQRYAADSLTWWPERGMGYFPVPEGSAQYDLAYWRRYMEMDRTLIGEVLTQMRIDLVAEHYDGQLLDVGIGGGKFVDTRPRTFGCDVNPNAIEYLQAVGLHHPGPSHANPVSAVSFWDSLEHIHDPAPLLAHVLEWVFVSLPIFRGPDHVLASKHYRRDEHVWYFTHDGFIRWMAEHGFSLVAFDWREQAAGREDIRSYAFRRTVRGGVSRD